MHIEAGERGAQDRCLRPVADQPEDVLLTGFLRFRGCERDANVVPEELGARLTSPGAAFTWISRLRAASAERFRPVMTRRVALSSSCAEREPGTIIHNAKPRSTVSRREMFMVIDYTSRCRRRNSATLALLPRPSMDTSAARRNVECRRRGARSLRRRIRGRSASGPPEELHAVPRHGGQQRADAAAGPGEPFGTELGAGGGSAAQRLSRVRSFARRSSARARRPAPADREPRAARGLP